MKSIAIEYSHTAQELKSLHIMVMALLLKVHSSPGGIIAVVRNYSSNPSAKLKIAAMMCMLNQDMATLTTAVQSAEIMISFRVTETDSKRIYPHSNKKHFMIKQDGGVGGIRWIHMKWFPHSMHV